MNLTIAVVTKDRPGALGKMLDSLWPQIKNLGVEVLVVDNSKKQTAGKLCKDYVGRIPNLVYQTEAKEGAVFARNRAIKVCKTKYLAFVDDDCILANDWLVEATKVVKNPSKGVVLWQGISDLANRGSSWAEAQYRQIENSRLIFEKYPRQLQFHVDTKNIILDVELLKRKKIFFDVRFGFLRSCGFEDVDLGISLYQAGYTGVLVSGLVVFHSEPTALSSVFKKYFNRGRISVEGEKKWIYEQLFKDFRIIFYDWRLVLRSLWHHTKEQKIFWCSEFLDLFYFFGYKYEKWRRSHGL